MVALMVSTARSSRRVLCRVDREEPGEQGGVQRPRQSRTRVVGRPVAEDDVEGEPRGSGVGALDTPPPRRPAEPSAELDQLGMERFALVVHVQDVPHAPLVDRTDGHTLGENG